MDARFEYMKKAAEELRIDVSKACSDAGRAEEPDILLASKYASAEDMNFLYRECGMRLFGENRVQSLLEKYDRLDSGIELHFIGSLQKNKVKYIADKVTMIHSVDSLSLAGEIDRQCAKLGRKMDILAEVNIGREESKGGVMPEDMPSFIDSLYSFSNIRLRGIMTMAPVCENAEEYRNYFRETYDIYIDNYIKNPHNIKGFECEPVLSMGMSGSYREAIAEGATLIRVGRAVFSASQT